jgi:putative redox protein
LEFAGSSLGLLAIHMEIVATPLRAKPRLLPVVRTRWLIAILEPKRETFMPTDQAKTARVQWIGNQQFVAVGPSGHAVAFDSDRGSNTAPGPMEFLLLALGACTATDVVIILEKKRQKLQSLDVICSGERAPNPPQVWSKLNVLYRLRGHLEESAVKQAIQLSEEKYCSVSATLKKTAQLNWQYEILPPAD